MQHRGSRSVEIESEIKIIRNLNKLSELRQHSTLLVTQFTFLSTVFVTQNSMRYAAASNKLN
jgi:cell division protein FtsX